MSLSMIVAASRNNVIGRDGELPWHLTEDLKRFRRLTMNHWVIMGRRTYESIGRELPGRRMLVLSRNRDFTAPAATVVSDWPQGLRSVAGDDEPFVIGGAEVYRQALPHVDRIYLTRIDAEVDGDTFLPPIDWTQWRCIERTPGSDTGAGVKYAFEVYERVPVWNLDRYTLGIVSDKLDEVVAFYQAHFGFRVAHDYGWYVQLSSPDQQFRIAVLEPDRVEVPQPLRASWNASGGIWLSFNVENIDQWHSRLKQAGVEVLTEIIDQPWGERHFVVADPAGMRVNIACKMKDGEQKRSGRISETPDQPPIDKPIIQSDEVQR